MKYRPTQVNCSIGAPMGRWADGSTDQSTELPRNSTCNACQSLMVTTGAGPTGGSPDNLWAAFDEHTEMFVRADTKDALLQRYPLLRFYR